MVKESFNQCCYQVVFCVKYKKELLVPDVQTRLKELIESIQHDLNIEVKHIQISPYFVQLLIQTDDKVSIGKIVFQIKRFTSGKLKQEFSELTKKVPNLWTNDSYIKTIGIKDEKEITTFLNSQKTRKEERVEKNECS